MANNGFAYLLPNAEMKLIMEEAKLELSDQSSVISPNVIVTHSL